MVVAAVVEIGEKLDDEEEVEEEEMLGVGVAMEVEGLVYDVERAWVYGCEGGSLMRERWQQQRATKQLMLFLISLVNVSTIDHQSISIDNHQSQCTFVSIVDLSISKSYQV